jgi:nucleoside 2-deoxyribosyltransferase
MRVYMAGPLGFSEGGRLFHARIIALLTELGHSVLDPWAFDPARIAAVAAMPYGETRREAWSKLNFEIGKKNIELVDQSDAVLAVLDGVDVDSGTAAEIGYAYARQKFILGYRGDFRLAGDNEGSIVNLQVEYFILASGGKIVASLPDLQSLMAGLT